MDKDIRRRDHLIPINKKEHALKLTNGEIFNAKAPLEELLKEKFPVKVSYGLVKLAAKLEGQLKVIEQVREGLIKTYGEPNPGNPNQISVTKANTSKFLEELGELFRQEVEIVIEPVTLPETTEISPGVLMALGKFITIN